jgi:hypothetical protein
MTAKQFKTLSGQSPPKFNPEFTKLVEAGKIGMENASIAARLSVEDQMLFAFQAENFDRKQFAATVNWWLRMRPERRLTMRQILTDLDDAFDRWGMWAGSYVGDEVEEYETMVRDAQVRVLSYVARLKVTLPRKDE